MSQLQEQPEIQAIQSKKTKKKKEKYPTAKPKQWAVNFDAVYSSGEGIFCTFFVILENRKETNSNKNKMVVSQMI